MQLPESSMAKFSAASPDHNQLTAVIYVGPVLHMTICIWQPGTTISNTANDNQVVAMTTSLFQFMVTIHQLQP